MRIKKYLFYFNLSFSQLLPAALFRKIKEMLLFPQLPIDAVILSMKIVIVHNPRILKVIS
jgi:hypothetical protein